MKNLGLLLLFLFSISHIGFTQSSNDWVFDDSVLPEVHVIIEPDSLAEILEFDNRYSNYEYPATFIFVKGEKRDTLEHIGFRLRGNTSRDSQKRSFKVSFNTFVQGREYHGLDKLNLNGEHNDPSIIRSKLSWDIFKRFDVPAPRANHVELYINEEYFGLYINVEHIDDEFVQDRFEGEEGNLYKNLWPADLSYISEDPDDYKWSPEWTDRRVYDLKTNTEEDDYSDLASLISFLEHSDPSEFENQIEDYINVDGVLRWMAIDVLTGNWDNYWYNQNNYYLYFNTIDQRFEFIPYDYDNTFGIDWVGQDWGERDINNWGQDQPLTSRILEVTEYRNRLHFYINKIIEEYFNEEVLFDEIDRLKTMTEAAAEADTFRTKDYNYGVAEYHASFNSALGGHVDYGLKPYITTRIASATQQLDLQNIRPIINDVQLVLYPDSELVFTVQITDEELDSVVVIIPSIEGWDFFAPLEIALLDNGKNRDVISNDGIYTGSLTDFLGQKWLTYRIRAKDAENKFSLTETKFFQLNPLLDSILINELMASNSSTISDEGGAFADWLELYNPTDSEISMSGFYLSDNLTIKNKWAFPDTTIQPNGYLLIWIDDDEEEGPLHASFNLSKDGEDIGLFQKSDDTYLTVDAFSYSEQTTDISYGRNGDGGEEFVLFDIPTPGTQNALINSNESDRESPTGIKLFQNYPNPFNPATTISFNLEKTSKIKLEVFSVEGRLIQTLVDARFNSGAHSVRFDASSLSSGIYFYRLSSESQSITRRLVLIK